MACIDTCPKCRGCKLCRDYLCEDCDGRSARSSYAHRTGMLAGNLRVAALEEVRFQFTVARLTPTPRPMHGDTVRAARTARRMTLRQLARALGVSAPFLSDVEHNRRRLSPDHLAKAKAVLKF